MRTTNHRLQRTLALATAVGAIAAPAAWAGPVDPPIPGAPIDESRALSYVSSGRTTPQSAPPGAVADDGFDWGAAGIGAAAILALAAIVAGAGVVVGHSPRGSRRIA